MSDQPGRESIEDDLGSYSVDDDSQYAAEGDSVLDQDDIEDPLDRGFSPPEKPLGVDAFGTTAEEQHQGESLEQRIQQEEPDPNTAYGAPDNESGLDEDEDRVGGDDPDAIAAEDDFIGDAEVGDQRAGRLVAPDEGAHEDVDHEMVGRDVGVNGAAASAEEAAMHIIEE